MENERKYLNVLMGLLILLVVVGHFGQTVTNSMPGIAKSIFGGGILFIYLFHMPMFLFVSGYLSRDVEKRRDKAFSDLFLPYLYFQIFCGICYWIANKNNMYLQNIFLPIMGAWYLFTLFCYRLLLPNLIKVKYILFISILLTVFACAFIGMDKTFAIRKSLGFLVYFLAGYYMNSKGLSSFIKQYPKMIPLVLLLVELLCIITILTKYDIYPIWLSVLTRSVDMKSFGHWYLAPIIYLVTFIMTSVTSWLVLQVIPQSNRFLEHLGADTMPMYLSHLILFMAVACIGNKSNVLLTVSTSSLCIILSLALFSCEWYKKLFHKIISQLTALFMDA